MAHLHCVYDGDTHFKINPATRGIENTTGKTVIMQNDHNSERFTFQIPRYVDGHDMSLCNKVEVHYNNIDSSTKDVNKNVYEVEDLQFSPDSENVVICSWLISGEATQYAGSLNFVLRFACLTGSTVDYQWFTDIYRDITVSESINNTQAVAAEIEDILAQWKAELEARYIVIDKKIRDSAMLKDDVRQTLGNSENLVISQKALSDFIADCKYEFENVELTVENQYYNTDGTLNSDTARVHAVYNVKEGDVFKLSTKIQKWGLSGYIFFDDDNNVISYGLDGKSQAQDIIDYELICPEGASKLIVQSTNGYSPPILKKGIRNYSAKWYTKAEIDKMLAGAGGTTSPSGEGKVVLDVTSFRTLWANYENNPDDVKYDGYSFAELKEMINNGVTVLIKDKGSNERDIFYYRHAATMSCLDEYTGEHVDMLVFETSIKYAKYNAEQGGFEITTGERAFTLTPYGHFGSIWQIREGEEL